MSSLGQDDAFVNLGLDLLTMPAPPAVNVPVTAYGSAQSWYSDKINQSSGGFISDVVVDPANADLRIGEIRLVVSYQYSASPDLFSTGSPGMFYSGSLQTCFGNNCIDTILLGPDAITLQTWFLEITSP
jgi:hypothetical protein